jgi:hypothetical protein
MLTGLNKKKSFEELLGRFNNYRVARKKYLLLPPVAPVVIQIEAHWALRKKTYKVLETL